MTLPSLEARWRLWLAVLFALGLLARLGVTLELDNSVYLRQHEWRGTHGSYMFQTALRVAGGDLTLGPAVPFLTPQMTGARPFPFWQRVWQQRLPRGSLAIYLLGLSLALTQSAALYTLASLLAGAALPPLAALAGARWHGRPVGLLAGVLCAASLPLIAYSVRIGTGVWEAFFALLLLWRCKCALDSPRNPGDWALVGLIVAAAIWIRGIFWWTIPLLALATWHRRAGFAPGVWIALLLPAAIGGGVLVARNARAEAPLTPIVGMPAWDLARGWNGAAALSPSVPSRIEFFEASGGSALKLLALVMRDEDERAAALSMLSPRLRNAIGARDVAADFNIDFLRRRSLWLRFTTLRTDVTMALLLGSAAFIALFGARGERLTGTGLVGLVIIAHTMVFTPWGEDRAVLHAIASITIARAVLLAWSLRHACPHLPFVFLFFWLGAHAALQVDDRFRGQRLRWEDFARSNNQLAREGRRLEANFEMDDWFAFEKREATFDHFGRATFRTVAPR